MDLNRRKAPDLDGTPLTALELAADLLATQIARGFQPAIDLSDQFAAAGVRLPLLNWPSAAAEPLRTAAARVIFAKPVPA
jgi:hypothetical protein